MKVLLGAHLYDANAAAAKRQTDAARANAALAGVDFLNVQPARNPLQHEGIETLAVLERDARDLVGFHGRPTPIASDLCDALAGAARRRGLRYFALINGDIIVSSQAIDRIVREGRDGYVFSRIDVDDSGRDLELMLYGVDLWAFDVDWWDAHRHRFRPYVVGGPCFDNVYTAIMLAHGNGFIENRVGEIRHVAHERAWATGPYERYNFYLAALDAPYFSMWARYIGSLEALRRGVSSAEQEAAMQQRTFVRRQSPLASIWHAGRCARARWRYARDRARFTATAVAAPR